MLEGQRTVGYCSNLVGELEAFSPLEWKRMYGHKLFESFMDEYLTAKCLTDFWWHLRYGVYFKAWRHYDNALHRRVADWLQTWSREKHGVREPVSMKALIMSRELCKTQLIIAWDGWKFARDPNSRLLIRAYDSSKAEEISAALMGMLRSEKYRRRYPWIYPATRESSSQAASWSPKEFMLAREDEDVRVPSCQAMGVKGQPTGGHFQLGHADDFEVDANANSDVEREEMFDTHRNDDNLFVAGSQRIIAGTPWSMLALIFGILNRKNGMEDHDIDVFKQACCVKVFDREFTGQDPVLLGDRVTVRQSGAGFPTAMEKLDTCQVTIRFFSEAAKDVVEEVREVVWNDGDHFRVNRPLPEILGQPMQYTIGVEKPACPVRQTLDSVNWDPEFGGELPPEVEAHKSEPGVDGVLNGRSSLPKKRQMQGSRIYALQQELEGEDSTALVLNSADLQVIAWADVPAGIRRWRRASDFASAKKTKAASSSTTGFELPGGFYITHISFEPRMGVSWKLLELLLGVKRVEALDGRLEYTSFEKSGHIEEVIGELLPDVCHDPYLYFDRLGKVHPFKGLPTFAEYAAQNFEEGKAVPVPLRWLSRTVSKNDRMSKQQPVWQAKKLFILEDCPHRQTLIDSADGFTMASEEPYDLLDNLADLLSAGRLLKTEKKAKATAGVSDYDRVLQEAGMDAVMAAAHGVNPGWK